MSKIENLFLKSPFTLLEDHMQKVKACVNFTPELFDAWMSEDFDKMADIKQQVLDAEFAADKAKWDTKQNLPTSILMPFSRSDLLRFIYIQDNIANHAEKLCKHMTIRNTPFMNALEADFKAFIDKGLEVINASIDTASRMHTLLETSFSNHEVTKVLDRIEAVCKAEYETSLLKTKVKESLYANEKDLDPVSIIFTHQIIDMFMDIVKSSEHASIELRLMLVSK